VEAASFGRVLLLTLLSSSLELSDADVTEVTELVLRDKHRVRCLYLSQHVFPGWINPIHNNQRVRLNHKTLTRKPNAGTGEGGFGTRMRAGLLEHIHCSIYICTV